MKNDMVKIKLIDRLFRFKTDFSESRCIGGKLGCFDIEFYVGGHCFICLNVDTLLELNFRSGELVLYINSEPDDIIKINTENNVYDLTEYLLPFMKLEDFVE